MKLRILYLILVGFCVWLALATRRHPDWFPRLVVTYGGDMIWSGMFLIFLRVFCSKIPVWKLTLLNYTLGVLAELSQLNQSGLMVAIRSTSLGRLLFGVGFLWSDLVCYAVGTFLAWCLISAIERSRPALS